ncbi:hypothetical protein PR202_ga15420 [Eleusine coracana subsp. coracana]|uniref:Uncharacterized protein n=1 Tax=Eleusine coracana subsp. coracana TaxID=191504 RepID=A0AAV5CK51_ELECO|nr:hypothetical protein PR202_ga15420 [Eleusine coracana subsp. coracana]
MTRSKMRIVGETKRSAGTMRESIYDMDNATPMTSDKLKKLGWSCRSLKETITNTVEFCKTAGFLADVEGEHNHFPSVYNKI